MPRGTPSATIRAMQKMAALMNKTMTSVGAVSKSKWALMGKAFESIKKTASTQWQGMQLATEQVQDLSTAWIANLAGRSMLIMKGFFVTLDKETDLFRASVLQGADEGMDALIDALVSPELIGFITEIGNAIGMGLNPALEIWSVWIKDIGVGVAWMADEWGKAWYSMGQEIATFQRTFWEGWMELFDLLPIWEQWMDDMGISPGFTEEEQAAITEQNLARQDIIAEFLPFIEDIPNKIVQAEREEHDVAGGGWESATNINITITDSVIESRDELVNEISEKIWQQMV